MPPDNIRFEALKEDRGWYFVEYHPPLENYRFAIVQLAWVEHRDASIVAEAMESEARGWLARYPIPVMVTAFSADADIYSLDGVRPSDTLMAWEEYPETKPTLKWAIVSDTELPDIALDRDFVEALFASIPHRTRSNIEEEVERHKKTMRFGWWLVFVWGVVVPAVVALLEWWSDFLGVVVLIYALGKAAIIALRLTGRLPKSAAQRKKEAEELAMQHHHYHCKRNPEAFQRLKAENFRRLEVERTLAEARSLKEKSKSESVDG